MSEGHGSRAAARLPRRRARASARRTRCSARDTGGSRAGRTSSSASSRRHGRAQTAAAGRGSRGRAAAHARPTAGPRSRRWTSTRCSRAGRGSRSSTSSRTPTSRARATRSGGRTSRSCSPPGSTSSPPSTSSTSSRSNDVVERSPASRQRETVPDDVVRRADQIELVDMTPAGAAPADGARQRLPGREGRRRAGEVLPRRQPHRAARARAAVGRGPRRRGPARPTGREHGIESTWPARERIVVALTGGPEGETLLRRGARIARRGRRVGTCSPSTWSRGDGVVGATPDGARSPATPGRGAGRDLPYRRRRRRRRRRCWTSPAASTPPRWWSAPPGAAGSSSLIGPGTSESIVRESGDIDVHVVTHERAGGAWWTSTHRRLARRRRLVAWAAAIVVPVVLTLLLHVFRGQVSLVTIMLAVPARGRPRARSSAGWHRPSSPRWSPGCLPTGSSRRRTAPSRSRSRRTHSPSWCSPSSLRLSRRSSTAAPHGPSGQPGGSRRSRSWPRSRAASCSRARTSRRCWSRRVRRSGCVRPRCSRRVMPVPGRRRGPWSPPPVSRS